MRTRPSGGLKRSTHSDVTTNWSDANVTREAHVRPAGYRGDVRRFSNWIHARDTHLYGAAIQRSYKEHNVTQTYYSLICKYEQRGGNPPEQTEIDGTTLEKNNYHSSETVERRAVFCGMSVGLTAPEERSRDHVCGAIIRQEGFQKGSAALITGKHADST